MIIFYFFIFCLVINFFSGHKDYSQPPVAHSNRDQRVVVGSVKGWGSSSSGGGGSSNSVVVAGQGSTGSSSSLNYAPTIGRTHVSASHHSPSSQAHGLSPVSQLGSLAGIVPAQADVYREYRRAGPPQAAAAAAAAAQVYVTTTQPTYLPSSLPAAHTVNPFTPGLVFRVTMSLLLLSELIYITYISYVTCVYLRLNAAQLMSRT